jgi:hypothetical protein
MANLLTPNVAEARENLWYTVTQDYRFGPHRSVGSYVEEEEDVDGS